MEVFLVDFILKLKGIRIIEAKTEEEKKMVYRLRYQIYKEYGYIELKDFPNGELKDEDDEHSISFLALKNNEPIGTVRLVLGNKKEDFPTFRVWNINFKEFPVLFTKIGEISKLCIRSSENRKFWIWLGLMKKVYKKNKELNLNYWVFGIYEKIKNHINKEFNTYLHRLPKLKDTELNLKEREVIAKFYFQSLNPSPYFLRIKEIGQF